MEVQQLCAMIKQRVAAELQEATDPGGISDILIDALYVLSTSVLPKLGYPRKAQEYHKQQEVVLDLITFLAIQLIRTPAHEGRGVAVLSEIGEGCLDPLLKKKLSVYAQQLLARASLKAEMEAAGSRSFIPWLLGPSSAAVLALFLAWQMAGPDIRPERSAPVAEAPPTAPETTSTVPITAPVPSAAHIAPAPSPSAQVLAGEGMVRRERSDDGIRHTARSIVEAGAGASDGKQITKVRIVDNQVLVPVTLHNGGGSVRLELVLDTGATRTAIHDGITSRLPIDLRSARSSQAELADGRMIWSRVAKIDSLVVGPFSLAPVEIGLIAYRGTGAEYDGLLGMDFLGKHRYQIDMEHELILWF